MAKVVLALALASFLISLLLLVRGAARSFQEAALAEYYRPPSARGTRRVRFVFTYLFLIVCSVVGAAACWSMRSHHSMTFLGTVRRLLVEDIASFMLAFVLPAAIIKLMFVALSPSKLH